jgi:hypothetical protein
MLVSVAHQPIHAPKKIVTNVRPRTAMDHDKLITGFPISFSRIISKEDLSVKIQNKPPSSKIFSIRFSYLGQIYQTKVLKTTYSGNQSLYKIAIGSNIAIHISICWLQYQAQGWVMLLGAKMDERLKQAITVAIERQEL